MKFEELVNQKPGSIIELKNGKKLLIENTETDINKLLNSLSEDEINELKRQLLEK